MTVISRERPSDGQRSTKRCLKQRMPRAFSSGALAALLLVLGCDSEPQTGGDDLDALVDAYERNDISRQQYLGAIAQLADDGASLLGGRLEHSRLLARRDLAYQVTTDLEIIAGATLVVAPGVELLLSEGVSIEVLGRFYAVGTETEPISITSPASGRYLEIALRAGPNQIVHTQISQAVRGLALSHQMPSTTLVESVSFDSWQDVAIAELDSSGLTVTDSRFGFDTPEAEVSGETIRSLGSGGITIRASEFSYRRGYRDVLDLQDCDPNNWPLVIGNRFDGGEDDAVDLDNCSAYVIGNHIRDFAPIDLANPVGGVNGGGITGDQPGSTPFIANNLIERCFHAIGFKDGSRPILFNNTIVDSNIGIALYQSAVDRPMPSAIAINNILSGNLGWAAGTTPDAENDVVLNGKWWPPYNQLDDVQATIDARFNMTSTLSVVYPGQGNLTGDPGFDTAATYPRLLTDSPAIDSGLEMLGDLGAVDAGIARNYLSSDFEGNPRIVTDGTLAKIDRGAFER